MKNHGRSIGSLLRNSQISIKTIGPIEVWDLHAEGADLEEIWIDLTVEIESQGLETRLVFDSPIQAEEFITKVRRALARECEETMVQRLNRKTKGELHELK